MCCVSASLIYSSMQTIYEYQFEGEGNGKYIDDIKKAFFIHASITKVNNESEGILKASMTFQYDHENNLLHVDTFKGTDDPIFENPITPEHLTTFLEFSNMKVTIRTSTPIDSMKYTSKRDIKDYSVMITDLSKKGIVEVKDSKNFLTQDGRVFRIKDYDRINNILNNYNDTLVASMKTDSFLEVDCLGTVLCSDISSLIEEIWTEIK